MESISLSTNLGTIKAIVELLESAFYGYSSIRFDLDLQDSADYKRFSFRIFNLNNEIETTLRFSVIENKLHFDRMVGDDLAEVELATKENILLYLFAYFFL
jgi:hypothetical protein